MLLVRDRNYVKADFADDIPIGVLGEGAAVVIIGFAVLRGNRVAYSSYRFLVSIVEKSDDVDGFAALVRFEANGELDAGKHLP